MLKAFILVALVAGAYGDLLSLPFCTVSQLVDAVNVTLTSYQRQISDGLVLKPPGFDKAMNTTLINFPGGLTLTAGIIALPIPFLCSQPDDSIILRFFCMLGSQDCTYVHNKYGGYCGYSQNPVANTTQTLGKILYCNDQNTTDYDFRNVNDPKNCGPLLGGVLDTALNLAVNAFLRVRFTLDLCPPIPNGPTPYDSVGCNSDCRNNHQYASGVCTTGNTPTAEFIGELNSGFQCICSY